LHKLSAMALTVEVEQTDEHPSAAKSSKPYYARVNSSLHVDPGTPSSKPSSKSPGYRNGDDSPPSGNWPSDIDSPTSPHSPFGKNRDASPLRKVNVLRAKTALNLASKMQARSMALWSVNAEHEEDTDTHGHKMHSREPSIISASVSGFINYLLMFGLCCAYGMIMFSDDHNLPHRALGVKMNLCTAFITGMLLACKSKVGVAIGGPDLNPVVFLGGFVSVMSESIAKQVGLGDDYPGSSRRLLDEYSTPQLRHLGGGGGGSDVDFCTPGGYHESKNFAECVDYHEQLRATAIFATAVSSGILGLLYFLLGHFKVTRLVSYVPTSVQEAFLSCIGYKVFKYALKFCNFAPLQFIPAACVGVPLYFLKAMHIGNPAIVIPGMVLAPLVVFYIVVFCAQLDIETMRTSGATDNWMFPRLEHVNFWELWTDSYGKADKINFKAWSETLPDLVIMIVVCIIDCLLKISSTESKLPVKVDKDYEASLYGLGNILTTASGSSVGYMQLKFNVINYGVIGNIKDRRAGVIYALLCGACFFGTIGHFNYLPRFFLGVLLFFAGTGFVAENLWGSRQYLSLLEWGEILLILAVFILSGSLVAAVIVGVCVTCVSLIMKYTRVSCIAGKPISGGSITSCERRNYLLLGQLSHIADSWFCVFRLKGFIFFASAQNLTNRVRQLIKEREHYDGHRKLRYIVLDCELLDGMDASAGKSLRKLLQDLSHEHIKILWSSVSDDFILDLLKKEMLDKTEHAFHTLDLAVLYIEEVILRYQVMVQKKFLRTDPMFELQHNLQRLSDEQEPWGGVLLNFTARHGCPWRYCHKVSLQEFATMLWRPGDERAGLFLIHSGKVALFDKVPDDENSDWGSPIAVYGHGWFLNRDALLKKPTKHFALAIADGEILAWTSESWWLMNHERPGMANEVWRAVMAQQAVDTGAPDWLKQQNDVDLDNADEIVEDDENESLPDQEDSAMEASGDSSYARAHLPEELKVLIASLEISEAFAAMGFYESIDPFELTKFPKLPNCIREDLKVAFNTYSVLYGDSWLLPWDEANNALMYAGVPRIPLAETNIAFLSEDEFIGLGHSATMARLPVLLVQKLKGIFKDFCKKNDWPPVLQVHQAVHLFRKAFCSSVLPETLFGVMVEMAPDAEVNEEVFICMISRLVQWHRQYWHLLSSIHKLVIENSDSEGKFVSGQMLTTEVLCKKCKLTRAQAAEMLWACDWRRGIRGVLSWGKMLHAYDVALAVLTCAQPPAGSLPPPPVLKAKGRPPIGVGKVDLEICGEEQLKVEGLEGLATQDVIADLQSGPERVKGINQSTVTRIESRQSLVSQNSLVASSSQRGRLSLAACPGNLEDRIKLSLRARLHILLEEPQSSTAANILSLGMAVLIILSIATMFVQPVSEHGREDDLTQVEKALWFYIELGLTVVFTVEYVLRVFVANALGTQTTFRFMISPTNLCDVAAIMPFYIEVAFSSQAQEFRLLRIVRLLRLTRIARIGRLAKRSPLFPPIAMVLIVIWGINMKNSLNDSK